jgi:hypothetical protein
MLFVFGCSAIDNPTSCKIHTVIRSFHTRNVSPEEIHQELCMMVYSQNVISEGSVRQWCRMFTVKSKVVSEPSAVFKVLTNIFVKDGASKFENFHVNFHKFHALFCMRLSQLG